MEEYSRAIARCAAGQIADSMGFEAVQESAIDMLSELMLRYLSELGTASHTYAELAGRTDINAGDVLLVLDELGADLGQLQEYIQSEGDNAFNHPLPKYPIRAQPRHAPTFQEMGEKPPTHIPSFLPALPDERTYKKTPVFAQRRMDKAELRRKQIKGRQQAEQALEKLSGRVAPGAPINYTAADANRWGHIPAGKGAEQDGSINPFLVPPAWEDQHPDRDMTPQKDASRPSLDLGGTVEAIAKSIAEDTANAEGAPKKIKLKDRPEGSSLPIDWSGNIDKTSAALSMASETARLRGFDATEPTADPVKEKMQARATEILGRGPAAVMMDIDEGR